MQRGCSKAFMSTSTLIFILLSIVLSVSAQLFLKTGMNQLNEHTNLSIFSWDYLIQITSNNYLILGLLAYVLSMLFWLIVLSKIEVSKAYPFVGLGFIGTMLAAHIILGESITTVKVMGTLFIVGGVIMVSNS